MGTWPQLHTPAVHYAIMHTIHYTTHPCSALHYNANNTLHYTPLQCFTSHCTAIHYTTYPCSALHHTALQYTSLYYTALHNLLVDSNGLQDTSPTLKCTVMKRITLHCNSAVQCITIQTHLQTLQCNELYSREYADPI